MNTTLRKTILAATVVGIGSFFLTGCNTVEGTMHGASKDVKAVEHAVSNDNGKTRPHHVNKMKHKTAHHKSMKKHTPKSGADSKEHTSMSSDHQTNSNNTNTTNEKPS